MTATQAHQFLSRCGRYWLARKDWNEYEIVSRMKTSCFCLSVQVIPMLVYALPKILHPKSVEGGNYLVPMVSLIFSVVAFRAF